MGVTSDVIFSVPTGLPKVYPNFFDVPHGIFQKCEKKLRVHLMHTGTPLSLRTINRIFLSTFYLLRFALAQMIMTASA